MGREREREREREGASEAEKGNLGVTFSANITCQTAYKQLSSVPCHASYTENK
jgi:hypothetical protein